MKTILSSLLYVVFLISFNVEAQNQVIKDSLSISKVVGLYGTIKFEDYEVKFKKVITDSRCPKNVMCVRAGEADVLVSIYNNGKFIEDKKIRIDANDVVMESTNLVYDAKDYKIYGFSLTPYPDGIVDIKNTAYKLELVFRPKQLK